MALLKGYLREAVAFGIGITVWVVSAYVSNWSDPQSAVFYWKISYPILIIFSGILGIIFPDRPWRWALYLIAAQLVMGILSVKGGLNLLPIGIVIHAIIALPCVLLSYGGGWLARIFKKAA